MNDMAKAARAAMKKKAFLMGGKGEPHEKVDASSWTPPEMLAATSQTGMRPISKRQYKAGGKVHGEKAVHHAGRKPRKSGGRALTPDNLINRNAKEANEERVGTKHIGGLKRGGTTHRKHRLDGGGIPPVGSAPGAMLSPNAAPNAPGSIAGANSTMSGSQSPMRGMIHLKRGGKAMKHDDIAEDKALIKKMVKPEARTKRKDGGKVFSGPGYPGKVPGATGGRTAHAAGGKAGKGKTNINITIDAGGKPPMPPLDHPPLGNPMPPPPPGMMGPPPGAPPMGGPPPGMPPAGRPPGMPPVPPPMPRKHGGRTNAGFPDMEYGAGGGLGRLEKIKTYG